MKRITKRLTLLLTLALSSTLLFACGNNQPTANELMKNAYGGKEITSGDMNMLIYMDMNASSAEEGVDISMDTKIKMDVDVLFDADTTHLKGDVEANVLGMSVKESMESYMQKDGDIIISYNKEVDSDDWVKSEEEDDNNAAIYTELTKIDTSAYKNLKLETKDKEYIVTGTMSAKDMTDALDSTPDEFFGGLTNNDTANYDELNVKVTATFDVKTQLLTKLRMDFSKLEAENFTLNEMYFEIVINKINDVKVDIPKTVLENIIEDEEDEWGDWDDDDNISTSDDSADISGNIATLHTYDGDILCSIHLPNGYKFNTEYTDSNAIVLEYINEDLYLDNIWVVTYLPSWVEDCEDGTHVCDTEWYIKDEVSKINETITTDQGKAHIYQRVWSMSEGYEFTDYCIVFNAGEEVISFELDANDIKEAGYTLEEIVKAMFNKNVNVSQGENYGEGISFSNGNVNVFIEESAGVSYGKPLN